MSESAVHPNLPPLPDRIKHLPVDARGFPVPWFVHWFHADGSQYEKPDLPYREGDYPDFRVVDGRKLVIAYTQRRCWVCGGQLGRYFAFVIGPMCAINRITSELPSHRDCATFAAQACPFLIKPAVKRRSNDLPEGVADPAGTLLRRNPGVALVWVTDSFKAFAADHGQEGVLFEIGPPFDLEWYAEGRIATRAEILESIDSGLPLLRAGADNEEGLKALDEAYAEALKLVPAGEDWKHAK